MNRLFGWMILLSVGEAVFTGRVDTLSEAVLTECSNAVALCLSLLGSLSLWGGFLAIAERSGLTERIASLLSPVTGRLFPSLKKDSSALKAISMNITANLLGLGNAATPLGIKAMKALKEETVSPPKTANHPIILFLLLNTASLQLLPTTVAGIRAAAGAKVPFDILPAVLVTSALSLAVALVCAFLCRRLTRKEGAG